MKQNKYLGLTLLVLSLKLLAMLVWLTTSGVELAPDEAQYWTWSQDLDFGYYSKPPGIAWWIALSTALFGSTTVGVRAGALVIGFLAPLVIFFLTKSFASSRAAFWAALITTLTPLGIFCSIYATTDGPYCIFWTICLIELVRAKEIPNYIRLGFWVAIGALFKWPIYAFWVVALLYIYLNPKTRSKKLLTGMGISLLGLLPPLIWNIERGFPTFLHVLATVQGGHAPKTALIFNGNFGGFLGAQVALLTPIFFVVLFFALMSAFKKGSKIRFLALLTALILGSYQFLSLFTKIQGNWAVYAYPSAIALIAWYLSDVTKKRALFAAALVVGALESLFILAIPFIHLVEDPLVPIPFKINRFRECMGWNQLDRVLLEAGYDKEKDFLLSDSYQGASLLSFYSPEQKRAFFFNLWGRRHNQFSYWPPLKEKNRGKGGLFITTEELPKNAGSMAVQKKETLDALSPHFKVVQFLEMKPFYCVHGKDAKALMIYRVEGYLGTNPEETSLY